MSDTKRTTTNIGGTIAAATTGSHLFGKLTSPEVVALCGDGEAADGILPYQYDAGDRAVLESGPILLVRSGAAFVVGPISSNATGRAIASVAGKTVNGYALRAATAADQFIPFLPYAKGKSVFSAAAIADLVAIAGGESPTEAEHNALRTAINSILAALRTAGIIAT